MNVYIIRYHGTIMSPINRELDRAEVIAESVEAAMNLFHRRIYHEESPCKFILYEITSVELMYSDVLMESWPKPEVVDDRGPMDY